MGACAGDRKAVNRGDRWMINRCAKNQILTFRDRSRDQMR